MLPKYFSPFVYGNRYSWSLLTCAVVLLNLLFPPKENEKSTSNEKPINKAESVQRSNHWSFQPVTRRLPDLSQHTQPIDFWIEKRLAEHSFKLSPRAEKQVIIRRLYLDLTGLLPSQEELEDLLADESPNFESKLIDKLLASPAFGERWGKHWLDQARYADSSGYDIDQGRPFAWRYRHWVVQALNEDLPFDQFSKLQIAGDLIDPNSVDAQVATGFHRNSIMNTEAGADPVEDRFRRTFDRVNTTATVWLGLTLGCAQCHDHKYDPISQRDYFQMMAFFDALEDKEIPAPVLDNLDTFQIESERHETHLAKIKAVRDAYVRSLDSGQYQHWRYSQKELPKAEWKVLHPESYEAGFGDELELLDDSSLLAQGPLPDFSMYQIVASSPVENVRAIRIEVLPDPSLPNNGPGRAPDGGFDLTKFELFASFQSSSWSESEEETVTFRQIRMINPAASYEAEGRSVARALAPDSTRGWSVGDQVGKRQVAIFELDPPLKTFLDKRLRIDISTGEANWLQVLGRFRISVSDTVPPFTDEDVPNLAGNLLLKSDDQLDTFQRQKLFDYFLNRDENWKLLNEAVQTRQRLAPPNPYDIQALVVAEQKEKRETRILERGDFQRPADLVARGTPSVLPKLSTRSETPDRLDLANWIFSQENPLTSRVAANRVWDKLMGQPIVFTDDDFGLHGTPPSHPELLDYLATEFRDNGWSLKRLIRTITLSETYLQSSVYREELAEVDPANQMFGRQNRIRLEGEVVRDQLLLVSGMLNFKMGGAPIVLPQPFGRDDLSFGRSRQLDPSWGDDLYRRSIYVWMQRTSPNPNFSIFDAPDSSVTCTRRLRSTTPLQSLVMLNDQSNFELAKYLAIQTVDSLPASDLRPESTLVKPRIESIFRTSLLRNPKEFELTELESIYKFHRTFYLDYPHLAKEILDSIATTELDPETQAELATWIVISRIVLNLEEFINRE